MTKPGIIGSQNVNPRTIFSHMFLHANLGHVASNMLFLWIFGDNVEDALGHARYVLFYFSCGVVAALAQVAVSPHAAVPMLGASGAIAGVLAAYGVLYPRSPIIAGLVLLALLRKEEPVDYDPWERWLAPRARRAA